jgi:predicted amidohydrolase
VLTFLAACAVAFTGADKNPGHLKMALVNLKSVYSDTTEAATNKAAIEANLRRHVYFIDKLAADGAEFIGFPELSVNGYHFGKNMTWLSLDGPEVKVLRDRAAEKGVYVAAGVAEKDADGKTWNTHVVIDPKGKIVGKHHKIWLTAEKGFTETGTEHNVFEVKGLKVGIATCADGTDRKNLQALVDNGANLIYGPHANTTGGTIAGWYRFRSAWGGENGWIAEMKVYAALHNHAGLYNADYDPPAGKHANTGWASGAWFIGPDGKTLAQMPSSTDRADSKEFVLTFNVPILTPAEARPDEKPKAEEKKAKVEFRRAEAKPADGLTKATVPGQPDPIYLHPTAEVTGADVAQAAVGVDAAFNPAIDITLTKEGGKKMGRLTEAHLEKPLAILVGGKVLTAPTVKAKIGERVQITGKFTKDEVERLVKAINGK